MNQRHMLQCTQMGSNNFKFLCICILLVLRNICKLLVRLTFQVFKIPQPLYAKRFKM
jgi:hypothetical protein